MFTMYSNFTTTPAAKVYISETRGRYPIPLLSNFCPPRKNVRIPGWGGGGVTFCEVSSLSFRNLGYDDDDDGKVGMERSTREQMFIVSRRFCILKLRHNVQLLLQNLRTV